MINEFVKAWDARKGEVRNLFENDHPEDYKAIVKAVLSILDDCHPSPDIDRIHELDDGDCRGTLVYVIPETDYQPDRYWYVMVSYGSCPVCDTLKAIHRHDEDEEKPTSKQVDDYMTLALHILQKMKQM